MRMGWARPAAGIFLHFDPIFLLLFLIDGLGQKKEEEETESRPKNLQGPNCRLEEDEFSNSAKKKNSAGICPNFQFPLPPVSPANFHFHLIDAPPNLYVLGLLPHIL
jgi:hypothetical protein